jgi:hypothetical protein
MCHTSIVQAYGSMQWLQLNAIRLERGEKANEGSEVPLKPLVEVLREAKEAKEEAFQAVWRSMKTGENHSYLWNVLAMASSTADCRISVQLSDLCATHNKAPVQLSVSRLQN